MTSAEFSGFLTPLPPLSEIYSSKITQPPLLPSDFGYPPPPLPEQTSFVHAPLLLLPSHGPHGVPDDSRLLFRLTRLIKRENRSQSEIKVRESHARPAPSSAITVAKRDSPYRKIRRLSLLLLSCQKPRNFKLCPVLSLLS